MGKKGERAVKKLFKGLARAVKPVIEREGEPDREEAEKAYQKTKGWFSRIKERAVGDAKSAVARESSTYREIIALFENNMSNLQEAHTKPSSLQVDLAIAERVTQEHVLGERLVVIDDFDGIYTKPGRNLTADERGLGIENVLWKAGIGRNPRDVLQEYLEATTPGTPKSIFTITGVDPHRLIETEKRIAIGLVETNRFSMKGAEEKFYLAVMKTLYENYRAFGTEKSPLRDDIAYALALRGIAQTHIIESMSPEPLVRMIIDPLVKALGLRQVKVNGTWYEFVEGRIPLDVQKIWELVHLNYAHRKAEKHKNVVNTTPVLSAEQAGHIIEAAEAILDDPTLVYVLEEYSVSPQDLVGMVDSTIALSPERATVRFHSDNREDAVAARLIKERNPQARVVFYAVGVDDSSLPPLEGVEIVPVKTPMDIVEMMAIERHVLSDLYTIGAEGIYRVASLVSRVQEKVDSILSSGSDKSHRLLAREEYSKAREEMKRIRGIERTTVYHALAREIENVSPEKSRDLMETPGRFLRASGYLAGTPEETRAFVSRLEEFYHTLKKKNLEKPLHELYGEKLPPPRGRGDLFSSTGAPLSATTPHMVRESIRRRVLEESVESLCADRPPEYGRSLERAVEQYTPIFMVG